MKRTDADIAGLRIRRGVEDRPPTDVPERCSNDSQPRLHSISRGRLFKYGSRVEGRLEGEDPAAFPDAFCGSQCVDANMGTNVDEHIAGLQLRQKQHPERSLIVAKVKDFALHPIPQVKRDAKTLIPGVHNAYVLSAILQTPRKASSAVAHVVEGPRHKRHCPRPD